MTIEERALILARELRSDCMNSRAPRELYLQRKILKEFVGVIEECAMIADKTVEAESQHSTLLGDHIAVTERGFSALLIAQNIRALAAPEEEGKESER